MLHGNIDNLLFRFNNNCQSPVSSVRHVAGEGVNGIKVSSSSGVGWSRPGEGDPASRSGDKPSSGRQNSLSVGKQKKTCFALWALNFPYVLDTVVSKVVIPRLQPSEQSSHVSPNKSTKVSDSQQPPDVISLLT